MSTVLNLLNASEFTDDRLTESINVPPYKTGRPAQLGIFTDTPIATTYVRLGVEDDLLTIIPARERGGESNLNMRGDRQGVQFDIPHFPLDDTIGPADIQNLVAFDSGYIMESLASVYNQKLVALRAKHDATHSHLDWGALNGLVLDGEGKVLLDIYSKFGLTENSISFDLNVDTTIISEKNREAKALVRKELRGAAATGIRVLAGPEFFDRYVNHKNVREELRDYRGSTANPSRDDIQDTFDFAGLTLERIDEEYKVRQPNGTLLSKKAVKDNEAIMVPLGTSYFKRYIAPPDTLSGANRRPAADAKVFVSTENLKHDKGKDIHTESNVLPICTRPQILVKLVMGQ